MSRISTFTRLAIRFAFCCALVNGYYAFYAVGNDFSASSFFKTRKIVLGFIGVNYAMAFASMSCQIRGLVSIMPIKDTLSLISRAIKYHPSITALKVRHWVLKNVGRSPWHLQCTCICGTVMGLCMTAISVCSGNLAATAMLLLAVVCRVCYGAVKSATSVFTNLQWVRRLPTIIQCGACFDADAIRIKLMAIMYLAITALSLIAQRMAQRLQMSLITRCFTSAHSITRTL